MNFKIILSIFTYFIIVNFMFGGTTSANSSNSTNPLGITNNINDVCLPSDPLLSLLGEAPASVDTPNSPGALGLSILPFFNGTPKTISLTPYWIFDHPRLSYEDYYAPDIIQSIEQTFLLSFTYNQNSSLNFTNEVGFGCKLSILSGKMENKFGPAYINIKKALTALGEAPESNQSYFSNMITNSYEMQTNMDKYLSNTNITYQDIYSGKIIGNNKALSIFLSSLHLSSNAVSNETIQIVSNKHTNLLISDLVTYLSEAKAYADKSPITNISDIIKTNLPALTNANSPRTGILMDVAFSIIQKYQEGLISYNSVVDKWGAWATLGYGWDQNSILLLARYKFDDDATNTETLESGLRYIIEGIPLNFNVIGTTFNYFSFSIEGFGSWSYTNANPLLWQISLIGEFKIDTSYLTVSVGWSSLYGIQNNNFNLAGIFANLGYSYTFDTKPTSIFSTNT